MFELIKNEFKRYRKWLLFATLINLCFLGLGIYLDDYERSGTSVGVAFTVLYGIIALLLGASQMRTYRPINMWTYLINRPVPPYQLAFSLILAGGLVLICSMTVPYVLLTFLIDISGLYIIDNRHYLQACYSTLMVISMYLTAAVITLSNNKTAYAVWLFPVLILATLINGGPIIMVSFIAVVWQLVLLLVIFKANLYNSIQSKYYVFGMALPFHISAFWALTVSVAFLSQVYLMLVDGAGIRISWNQYFPENSYEYTSYQEPGDRAILGLSDDASQQADYLIRQLKNSEVSIITPKIKQQTEHQQLPYLQNFSQLNLADSINDMNWTFSHDQMAFLNKPSFNRRGHINQQPLLTHKNQNDGLRFNQIPVVMGMQIITPQTLYTYDPYLQQIDTTFAVESHESLLTPLELKGQHYAVLTTAALYLFDPLLVENQSGLIKPITHIPLPDNYENLTSIEISSLMDSHLISFLYGELSEQGQHPAMQITLQLNHQYQPIHTSKKSLINGFNELYRHRGFYLSPLIHVIDQRYVEPAISASYPQAIKKWHWPQLSTQLILIMLISALSCAALTYGYLRKRLRSKPAMMAYVLISFITCFTGLLFCVLLHRGQRTETETP